MFKCNESLRRKNYGATHMIRFLKSILYELIGQIIYLNEVYTTIEIPNIDQNTFFCIEYLQPLRG